MIIYKSFAEQRLRLLYEALDKYFKRSDPHFGDCMDIKCLVGSCASLYWLRDFSDLIKDVKDV